MCIYKVEPLYSGHLWDPDGCPVWRGVPNSEVDLYTALYVFGTADSVLIREVSFIKRFYCIWTEQSWTIHDNDTHWHWQLYTLLYVPATPALHAQPVVGSPITQPYGRTVRKVGSLRRAEEPQMTTPSAVISYGCSMPEMRSSLLSSVVPLW